MTERPCDDPASRDAGHGEAQDALDAEAAAWLVRLEGGPLDCEERRAFEAWLERGPATAAALAEVRDAWDELRLLACLRPASNDIRPAVARRRVLGALAASLLLAAGLGVVSLGDPVTALTADIRTRPGELRSVTLPDGSRAELDSGTALVLRFGPDRRLVELREGAAVFTVTPASANDGRPFVVSAAGGEAEALGTRFLVAREDEIARVAVLEHRVAVSAPTGESGRSDSVVLQAGQQVAYGSGRRLGPIGSVEAATVAPWREGRLVFDKVPLSEAVATLNRYRRGRILVLDRELAERRVSGVFNLDQLDGALRIITAELQARSLSLPPFVTLIY